MSIHKYSEATYGTVIETHPLSPLTDNEQVMSRKGDMASTDT